MRGVSPGFVMPPQMPLPGIILPIMPSNRCKCRLPLASCFLSSFSSIFTPTYYYFFFFFIHLLLLIYYNMLLMIHKTCLAYYQIQINKILSLSHRLFLINPIIFKIIFIYYFFKYLLFKFFKYTFQTHFVIFYHPLFNIRINTYLTSIF